MDKKLIPYKLSDTIWMVPCLNNREGNEFQPIVSPIENLPDIENLNFKNIWTAEEDEALENLTKMQGTKAWTRVATEINRIFHQGRPFRKGKQCRERFFNHINPALKKGQWSIDEDQYILDMQRIHGNKWSDISKALPGRNENQVKNRWKSLMNKMKWEKNIEKKVSQVAQEITPATCFIPYKAEPGFSNLAECIMLQYHDKANDSTPPYSLFA